MHRGKGRPKGSKDRQPGRVRSHKSLNITWDYGGKQGAPGAQFASIGDSVQHDSFPMQVSIIQQPSVSALVIQVGDGENATLMSVAACDVQASSDPGAGSSNTAGQANQNAGKRKRLRKGARAGPSCAAQLELAPLSTAVTKEVIKEVRKRKRREETAEARGKPLKAAREQKNRKWEAVYKQQAIALFNAKFSSGPKPDYARCRNELLKLPGFDGVTSANIQGWLLAESRMATQQPNELGLIVAAAGRKPTLPSEMYAELAT